MNIRTKVPTSAEQVVEQVVSTAPAHPVVVHQAQQKAYPPAIAKALLKITRELQPVKKAGHNSFHKYNYPKWEDVLDELGPKMAENGLIITMNEVSHGGFQDGKMIEVVYEFTIVHEEGDVWPDRLKIPAMCKMIDNKGQIDDKAASKAHTQAHKYFLMQLFKIRTRDMGEDDHDNDQPPQQQAQRKRPVPTSTGKVAPFAVPTIENDTAGGWATRFFDYYQKAETNAECETWVNLNDSTLTKLQKMSPDTYDKLAKAVQEKDATLAPAKPDPISSGPTGGFPGDKAMKDGGIPEFLRHQGETFTKDEENWLHGLGGAFSGCEDQEELDKQNERLMAPQHGRVSAAAWRKAIELWNEHVERLGGE